MLLIFGFLFTVFVYAVIGLTAGFISVLIDPWSLLFIIVSMLFFLFISKSGSVIGQYVIKSFKKVRKYTLTELEGLSIALKNTIKFTLFSGVFCFITFAVISLGHVGSPELLGPSIAICLTSLAYSFGICCFIFFPTLAWVENKINIFKNDL